MNNCINAEVRDALPDLLHGRLSDLDRATMKAHVESCADCSAELALMERVRAYAPIAPRIDVSRIVAALPAPVVGVHQQVAPVTSTRGLLTFATLWKVAAVAAVMVVGTLTFTSTRHKASPALAVGVNTPATSVPVQPSAAPVVLPAPAQVVAANTPTPAVRKVSNSTVGLSLTGGVQDLTDAQLEALLKEVDSVDGLPAAEPEAINVSVEGDEGSY